MAKSQADMVKIGVAVVALIGAAFLLAKFAGFFDGNPAGPQRTTEEDKQIEAELEEQIRIQKEQEEAGLIEIGGA